MSQAHHSGNESEETYHQHSETARIDTEFDISLTDLELKAKQNAVGTAASEGAKKFASFTKWVVCMLAMLSVTAIALAVVSVHKIQAESR